MCFEKVFERTRVGGKGVGFWGRAAFDLRLLRWRSEVGGGGVNFFLRNFDEGLVVGNPLPRGPGASRPTQLWSRDEPTPSTSACRLVLGGIICQTKRNI